MEKNATVYTIHLDSYHKIVCPDKKAALEIFDTLSKFKLKQLEQHDYSDKYNYVGQGVKITLNALLVDLYNCKEEARVAKVNEDKLIKTGIMKDKRKAPKVKKIKK